MNPSLQLAGAVAKGMTKASIKEAQSFLSKLAGPGAEELGLLIQDSVKLWRFKNQFRVVDKARLIVSRSKLPPKVVPHRTLIPLLEGASLEDEPSLVEKWASLLANAALQESNQATHPAFSRILSELTPIEAAFLDELAGLGKTDWMKFRTHISHKFNLSKERVNETYGNLDRLGLCLIARRKPSG